MLDEAAATISAKLVTDPEHVLNVIETLVERWHRADKRTDAFSDGRREGYTQAIQLLLGVEHSDIAMALRGDQL